MINAVRFEVIDDFLEEEYFKDLQGMFMGPGVPWQYNSDIENVDDDSESDNFFYMTHAIYDNCTSDGKLLVQHYTCENLMPLVRKLNSVALIRIKANLFPNQGEVIEHRKHVDYEFQHQGAILSLNTNDGYTLLEDGTKVGSIANRILLFDASRPHCSTTTSNTKVRVNINLNYYGVK